MIINSLLDIDFYKLTMMQLAYFKHRDVEVEFSFFNRTKSVSLIDFIHLDDLICELEHITTLKITNEEYEYLKTLPELKTEFIDFLRDLKLKNPHVLFDSNGKDYDIIVTGMWCEITLWETLILSVVNELYTKSKIENNTHLEKLETEGMNRLWGKINKLLKHNSEHSVRIPFTEFGTRRRFSREWQYKVVKTLFEVKKITGDKLNFIGTSNVYLSMLFHSKPIGTFAHELYMVYSGIYDDGTNEGLRTSHNKVLQDWFELYGKNLSIALTDTYGTDFFITDFSDEQYKNWKGVRHDSGDPFLFTEKIIKEYKKRKIDTLYKNIVYSDGLDVDSIIELSNKFMDMINVSFGWGTNMSNDLSIESLSLVVKVTKSNGKNTVKLSDNINKALGSNEDIIRYKEVFKYNNQEKKELIN